MSSIYYDRDGSELTQRGFSALLDLTCAKGGEYRRVGEADVSAPDGSAFWVSTLWLGIDHNFGDGAPLIFETMAFLKGGDDPGGWDQQAIRWSTEGQAQAGHRAVVEAISSGVSYQDWEMTR